MSGRRPPFLAPTRRRLLGTGLGLAFTLPGLPAWAQHGHAPDTAEAAEGRTVNLAIAEVAVAAGGRRATATTVNGTLPGPCLRFREGETAIIDVTNHLDRDTSIHWHGILLPADMDGVPGVSFPGIRPGETFRYRYTLRQSGTYWYHSHSGLQEQTGLYGPLIVDPAGADPIAADREHVVLLSDWTFESPQHIFATLKKMGDYYNRQQPTVGDFFRMAGEKGLGAALRERMRWGRMRMSPADIADVGGATYTYLMNGRSAAANWTGLFQPGERVRLRIINGASMTYFNLRIPGLPMTVVQADGNAVQPVTVDEFQIGPAETLDVIVEPRTDEAFTVMAESMDRSGFVRGTLAPRLGMEAAVPALRDPPRRSMADMGMDHGAMDHGTMAGMDHMAMEDMAMDHASMDHGSMDHASMDHGAMADMAMEDMHHGSMDHGSMHRDGPADMADIYRSRLSEPGTGLENTGHRVLAYADLKAATAEPEPMADREMELHLTGNMERYMWSFDGVKFSEVKGPIHFRHGERVRLSLVNQTMMEHPIHLHGMWMRLDTGHGARNPRKHTISVKPAERLSVLIEAEAPGDWAFHCHLLYHMEAGMFRVVRVGEPGVTG
jgi:CopA family copper-resistance protein